MDYQEHGIASVWDRVARGYYDIDVNGVDYQASINVLLRHAGNPAGKTFCEVGCGSGVVSAVLARHGGEITLVDISPEALVFAGEFLECCGVTARLCLNDALQMEFSDQSFDVVWNFGVIEHFYDAGKVRLLSEMWRILKPGGLLFLTGPNRLDLPFMLYKRWALWRGTWPYGYEDDMTVGRLAALGEEAGLSDMEVFAFNPVVGWWFLKGGWNIMQMLRLNTVERHMSRNRFGHVICLAARKPLPSSLFGAVHES